MTPVGIVGICCEELLLDSFSLFFAVPLSSLISDKLVVCDDSEPVGLPPDSTVFADCVALQIFRSESEIELKGWSHNFFLSL